MSERTLAPLKLMNRMRELGLTQRQVQRAVPVADMTFRRWIEGEGGMRLTTYIRLCEVLQVELDDLLEPTQPDPSESEKESSANEVTMGRRSKKGSSP